MSFFKDLRKLAADYKHFSADIGRGQFHLFNVTECEICGCELLDVNAINISGPSSTDDLLKAGLTFRSEPFDEGGYSELHECSTCSECCYDHEARSEV